MKTQENDFNVSLTVGNIIHKLLNFIPPDKKLNEIIR